MGEVCSDAGTPIAWAGGAFAARFGLTLLALGAAAQSEVFRLRIEPGIVVASAEAGALALQLAGEAATASDRVISSTRASLVIGRGCTGLEPLIILSAGILAMKASWKARLAGVATSAGLLFLLNTVRVVALYFATIHAPEAFDTLHRDLLPAAIIIVSGTVMLAWAHRASAGS